MMSEALERLDPDDREKVKYFLDLLLRQAKYKKLREEIEERREEVRRGETIGHDDLWGQADV